MQRVAGIAGATGAAVGDAGFPAIKRIAECAALESAAAVGDGPRGVCAVDVVLDAGAAPAAA